MANNTKDLILTKLNNQEYYIIAINNELYNTEESIQHITQSLNTFTIISENLNSNQDDGQTSELIIKEETK